MDLLHLIDSYCDAAPRTGARAEDIGPFTLFVGPENGWRYYARPAPGACSFTPAAVQAVQARQRELRMPESFEWIKETQQALAGVMQAAGMAVRERPLMSHDSNPPSPLRPPSGVELRLVTPDDDLALIGSVAYVAFSFPGTAAGPVGTEALEQAVQNSHAGTVQFERDRLRAGFTVMAAAFAGSLPVCIGAYQPLGHVAEIVGVGALPAWRRRGIASALTGLLARHAREQGATTIFLSAGDHGIARVYERAGFRTIGTACDADPSHR